MAEQFTIIPYALALLLRENEKSEQEVLLIYRSNTGFRDNHYGLVGGKIEEGETPHQAIVRELHEEVGIIVDPANAQVKHVRYFMGQTRLCVCFAFVITTWVGEPFNREPDKHDHIKWFPINNLPPDIIPRHEAIITGIEAGIFYAEESIT